MELQEIFYTLAPESGNNNLLECFTVLDGYLTPKVNVPFERHMFRQMQQNEDETMDQFVSRFRQKSVTCEFANVDEAILDQIIEKCRYVKLRWKFLGKSGTVSLNTLQDPARVQEAVDIQMQSVDRSDANQVHGIFPGDREGKRKHGSTHISDT